LEKIKLSLSLSLSNSLALPLSHTHTQTHTSAHKLHHSFSHTHSHSHTHVCPCIKKTRPCNEESKVGVKRSFKPRTPSCPCAPPLCECHLSMRALSAACQPCPLVHVRHVPLHQCAILQYYTASLHKGSTADMRRGVPSEHSPLFCWPSCVTSMMRVIRVIRVSRQ